MESFEFLHIRKFVKETLEYIYEKQKVRYTLDYKYIPASDSFSSGFKRMILILYKNGKCVKDFTHVSMNVEEGYCNVLYQCFNYLICNKNE